MATFASGFRSGGSRVITCPKCAKDNQDHYKFCLGCGAELPRETAPKPFIPQTPPQAMRPAGQPASLAPQPAARVSAAPPLAAAAAAPQSALIGVSPPGPAAVPGPAVTGRMQSAAAPVPSAAAPPLTAASGTVVCP